MYDFTICKLCHSAAGSPRYHLREERVFVCSACGFHYIDHLDLVEDIPHETNPATLTEQERSYISSQLESNSQRFENHVKLLRRYAEPRGKRILDIGCGGGRFLWLMKNLGAEVTGLELNDPRIQYSQSVYGVDVRKFPVGHEFWQDQFQEKFDVVTMWDVIEHVDFPGQMIEDAVRLLAPGGLFLLDTPCRDATFHRIGALTARLTGGRFPTLLNAMYSSRLFGHKQILSSHEMIALLEGNGCDVLMLKKLHELSFPCRFYLKRLLRSAVLVELAHPLVLLATKLLPIANKMIVVARKPTPSVLREREAA